MAGLQLATEYDLMNRLISLQTQIKGQSFKIKTF